VEARDGLIKKDLIAFNGTLFQVLDLPHHPIQSKAPQPHESVVSTLIQQSLWEG
jgi:hypothetical protein